MMWEAPAKLNLSLVVSPPRADGLHPLRSLVQIIDWCDLITVDRGDRDTADQIEVSGAEIDPSHNLVAAAFEAVRAVREVPHLECTLRKSIPMRAGLGGGSSNAAAGLLAAASFASGPVDLNRLAAGLGADVPLFLEGGTLTMTGIGEHVEPRPTLDLAFAVVVPAFGLSTPEVYRRWDELEGPVGESVHPRHLPPALRGYEPIRNDLTPAAVDVDPRLGDFLADLRAVWGVPALMTGSGSACFGLFTDLDESTGALRAVEDIIDTGRAVRCRPRGVALVDPGAGSE